MNKTLVIFAIVVFALLGGAGLYIAYPVILEVLKYSGGSQQVNDDNHPVAQAIRSYRAGNFEEARSVAEEYLAENADVPNAPYYDRARILQMTAAFATADTKDERLEAIDLAIQQYHNQTNPTRKAHQVNRIIAQLLAGWEPYLLDAIFEDSAFSDMRGEGHMDSIRNLAEFSLSLAPTSLGTALYARAEHVEWIYNHAAQRAKPEIEQELRLRADALERAADEAEALFAEEKKFTGGFPDDITIEAAFYYWQGYLRAAEAVVFPSRLADAEAWFKKVYEYYDYKRDSSGALSPSIARFVVYARLAETQFLDVIDAVANGAKIRANLEEIVQMVVKAPDQFGYLRVAFSNIKNLKAAYESFEHAPNGLNTTNTDRNDTWVYGKYVKWAAQSPGFRTLLEQSGWEF